MAVFISLHLLSVLVRSKRLAMAAVAAPGFAQYGARKRLPPPRRGAWVRCASVGMGARGVAVDILKTTGTCKPTALADCQLHVPADISCSRNCLSSSLSIQFIL